MSQLTPQGLAILANSIVRNAVQHTTINSMNGLRVVSSKVNNVPQISISENGHPQIDLPQIPSNMSQEALIRYRSWLDHEVGHLVAGTKLAHKSGSEFEHHILNAIEDARTDAVMSRMGAGFKSNLRKGARQTLRSIEDDAACNPDSYQEHERQAMCALFQKIYNYPLDFVLPEYKAAADQVDIAMLTSEFASFDDAVKESQRYISLLPDPPKQEQSSPDNDDNDDNEEDEDEQDDQQNEQSDSGEENQGDSGDGDGEGEQGQGDIQGDSDSRNQSSPAESPKYNVGSLSELQAQQVANDVEQAVRQGGVDRVNVSEFKSAGCVHWHSLIKEVKGGVDQVIGATLTIAEQTKSDVIEILDFIESGKWKAHKDTMRHLDSGLMLKYGKALTRKSRSAIRKLLLAETRSGKLYHQPKGQINARDIARLAAGVTDRPFARNWEDVGLDTVVDLLVDMSGSMANFVPVGIRHPIPESVRREASQNSLDIRSLHHIAPSIALAMAQAIEQGGGKAAISYFSDAGSFAESKVCHIVRDTIYKYEKDFDYSQCLNAITTAVHESGLRGKGGSLLHMARTYPVFCVKDYDEQIGSCPFIRSAARDHGGTLTARSMISRIPILADRPEQRKVMVVVTDGQPNDYSRMIGAEKMAKQNGIAIYCLVIGSMANAVIKESKRRETTVAEELVAAEVIAQPKLWSGVGLASTGDDIADGIGQMILDSITR